MNFSIVSLVQVNIAIMVMAVKEVRIESQKVSKIEMMGVEIEQMSMMVIPQKETRVQKQVEYYYRCCVISTEMVNNWGEPERAPH